MPEFYTKHKRPPQEFSCGFVQAKQEIVDEETGEITVELLFNEDGSPKDGKDRPVEPEHTINIKNRIEAMKQAGLRLEESRKNAYHFPNLNNTDDVEVNEEFIDPTLNPSFDEIDVQEIMENIQPVEPDDPNTPEPPTEPPTDPPDSSEDESEPTQ